MTTTTLMTATPAWPAPPNFPDEPTLTRMLDKTKGRLFFKKGAGFLGSLLCNHRFIWDWDAPTAWCNGTTIGFGPEFFYSLGTEQRVTLLAHELWHTGYDHMARLKDRDPQLWNWAADYVINNSLDIDGFSFEDMHPLLDHQYDGMSTDEVYDLLIQQYGTAPKMMARICKDGAGGDVGEPMAGGPGQPDLSGDLREMLPGTEMDVKSKIVQAIQASRMSKEAGVIPGETELLIDDFLNPVLPWEVLLQRYFSELSKDDYSWKRPSRRHEHEYLPSLDGDNGLEHLIYYLDVSGSVSDDEIRRFNSEVKFIHESLVPKRLTLVTFDTEIHDIYEFTDEDVFEKIVVHGRGGTSLECVRRHIIDNKPTAAVVFSDLYCHPMADNPGHPVLWVVMDNKRATIPYGTRIDIRKDQI